MRPAVSRRPAQLNSPVTLIISSQIICARRARKRFRSEKLRNESSPNFSNFGPGFWPEFCSEISPNFSRIFRASFRGKRRPEKFTKKSPAFFNAKFPGKYEKDIHKMFLESRRSKKEGGQTKRKERERERGKCMEFQHWEG